MLDQFGGLMETIFVREGSPAPSATHYSPTQAYIVVTMADMLQLLTISMAASFTLFGFMAMPVRGMLDWVNLQSYDRTGTRIPIGNMHYYTRGANNWIMIWLRNLEPWPCNFHFCAQTMPAAIYTGLSLCFFCCCDLFAKQWKQLIMFIFSSCCFFGAGRCPIHPRGNKSYCLSITGGCQIIPNETYPWNPQEQYLFYLIVFDSTNEFLTGIAAARVIHGIFVEAKANGLLGQCLRVRSENAIWRKYLEWKKV
jgi:hypothetical protein